MKIQKESWLPPGKSSREAACLGCKRPILILGSDPGKRICQDCREEMLENLAFALDRSYDRKALHEAEELYGILARMYGTYVSVPWNG